MTMNDDKEFFERLENGYDPFDDYIGDLGEVISSFQKEKLTKDDLMAFVDSYDVYYIYHMLFDMFGCDMSKSEYMKYRERYVKIFDLAFVPLPQSCLELDAKWGIENV